MKLRPRRSPNAPAAREASFVHAALLDATHDAYADWREESSAVEHRYTRWRAATRDERALAFAAYAAALEREERAAEVYADLVDMAQARLGGAAA